MTRHRPHTFTGSRPTLFRPVVSLAVIYALIVSAFMPLAQASSLGAGTLLAALCSPNGVRYVEIDLDVAGQDAPSVPPLAALDHCPGCLLGGVSALLPVAFTIMRPPGGDRIAPDYQDRLPAARAATGFQSRAPPPVR